tara:strand:+ start:513 stop:647 length:135 start_codon:yes stop_codon:yes gene_type:complete
MKRLLIITAIAVLVIWVGAGCKTPSGSWELDSPFIDIEYTAPEQ